MWTRNTGQGQKWWIRYVDSMKPEPKKGQLNPEFGLYVERPFHIVSMMHRHRYLDVINGRDLVIKTPTYSRKTQIFWFDQRTKTIKSHHHRSYSFNIMGNGGQANLKMWSTNSRWW
jgi:hypothetical protein